MVKPRGMGDIERIVGPVPIVGETMAGEPIIDPVWTKQNIVEAHLCKHRVWVHRLLKGDIREVSFCIQNEKLSSEIRRVDSLCVRWVRGYPGVLSWHAVGLALDVNPDENPLGARTCAIHPRIVEIFKAHGFIHGADWVHRPDPMEFRFVRGLK